MRELGDSLGADELAEWMAYAQLEPWGCNQEDWRAALITAAVQNQWVGKDDRPVRPQDLMPDYTLERAKRRRRAAARRLRAAWQARAEGNG